MIQQGKLIVIEGGDGSGKGTQATLLKSYLDTQSVPYTYVDFPDYESIYGKIIAGFLRGEYGTINDISPYFVSTLFALDRSLIKNTITNELAKGHIVLANRYVTSNIAHQGSKLRSKGELDTFIHWLEHFEYTVLGLPKEDIVLYLSVPWQVANDLTKSKSSRAYLKGKSMDIQEEDEAHREDSENMYDYLAQTNAHWTTIDCVKNGTIMSKGEIHEAIVNVLKNNKMI